MRFVCRCIQAISEMAAILGTLIDVEGGIHYGRRFNAVASGVVCELVTTLTSTTHDEIFYKLVFISIAHC